MVPPMQETKKIFVFSFVFMNFIWGGCLAGSVFGSAHPRYEIRAEIDADKKVVTASQRVTFTNTSSRQLEEVYFHIYPHRQYSRQEKDLLRRYAGYFKVNPFPDGFQSPDFQIQSVTQDSAAVFFQTEGEDQTLLKVSLIHPLAPGETVELDMAYMLKIPHGYGRLGWHENIIALSRWYPILSVYNDQGWCNYPFYPFHRPFFSDAADYSVELTVARPQVVVHSGVLIKEEMISSGAKKLTIDSKLPIREFSLALSPEYLMRQKKLGGTEIMSYYLPGDEGRGLQALESALGLMRFYAKKFGDYPYEVFSVAPVHLGYGGEQMSNMTYIDTRVYQLPGILNRYFDFLIAHETGHQWFYNLVGIDEYTQMWLEEGVHSYFIQEYIKEKYGPKAQILEYPSWAKALEWFLPELTFQRSRDVRYKMISRIGLDHPVVGELSSFSEPSSIFSLTYGKGSRIVAMLKDILGPEVFDKVFERVFKEYTFKNLDVKEFIRMCENESGRDLTWFFDPWLYTDEHYDVAVTKVRGNRITVENKGGIGMPVDIAVQFDNQQEKMVVWDGRKKTEEIVLEGAAQVKRVEADPGHKWLDLDRTNNTWPRHVQIKPVPLYLGLYDTPYFMPDDSYNFVFGPELSNGGLGVKASLQKPYDQNFYTATDYEFSESILHSRAGYVLKNFLKSQTALGVEAANRTDYEDGDDDLVSGKVFLRRELWPVQYGLLDTNDHVTLYMIRNQSLNGSLSLEGGPEDTRNISYLKHNEAIVGTAVHFERSSPYPDPRQGFKMDALLEHSGHFLQATQYFYRAAMDASFYKPVTNKSRLAFRFKCGWGEPDDKNLFELGGLNGLRGFDRKEIRGAKALLGSVEYRFPLKDNLRVSFMDHLFGLESIGGVIFFDAGQSWYSDFQEAGFKKDAGLGLRATVSIGSFLEKAVLRADVAQAINQADEDPHFWFGVNQAF